MFCNNTRLSFFACQKDAAGAALKKAAPALGSGQIKNRLRLHPKSGGSGSATLALSLREKVSYLSSSMTKQLGWEHLFHNYFAL